MEPHSEAIIAANQSRKALCCTEATMTVQCRIQSLCCKTRLQIMISSSSHSPPAPQELAGSVPAPVHGCFLHFRYESVRTELPACVIVLLLLLLLLHTGKTNQASPGLHAPPRGEKLTAAPRNSLRQFGSGAVQLRRLQSWRSPENGAGKSPESQQRCFLPQPPASAAPWAGGAGRDEPRLRCGGSGMKCRGLAAGLGGGRGRRESATARWQRAGCLWSCCH